MVLIYTNHAGTLSESFAIGKRGIKLLQGTADPTGVEAPTGSLYVRRDASIQRVFQIDAEGVWHRLVLDTDIQVGPNLILSNEDGVITIDKPNSKYKQSFTSASLSNGVITVSHNLNEDYPLVQIYNNNKNVIVPDAITSVTANSVSVDLSSYGAISGTWRVTVLAD